MKSIEEKKLILDKNIEKTVKDLNKIMKQMYMLDLDLAINFSKVGDCKRELEKVKKFIEVVDVVEV